MPIVYEDGIVRFRDHCAIEEAVELAEKLADEPMPELDLSDCGVMHSALFQLIVAARPRISGFPENGHMAQLLRKAVGVASGA
jgi:hypothetical protein